MGEDVFLLDGGGLPIAWAHGWDVSRGARLPVAVIEYPASASRRVAGASDAVIMALCRLPPSLASSRS